MLLSDSDLSFEKVTDVDTDSGTFTVTLRSSSNLTFDGDPYSLEITVVGTPSAGATAANGTPFPFGDGTTRYDLLIKEH
jgi:hypothetical protein